MMNIRYKNIPLVKKGPLSLTAKLMLRMATRTMGYLPQDNLQYFPIIYDELNSYYKDQCGESAGMRDLFEKGMAL